MKEIGGYIQFEKNYGSIYHEGAVALNCGRNALAYLIKAKQIKKIVLPYFLCHSVRNLCTKHDVAVRFYHINESLVPDNVHLEPDEWLYVVNYYGQLSQETILLLNRHFKRVILDNAQDYFRMPIEKMDTIYSCRKFFGVSDGAFLYTDLLLKEQIPQDESFERMGFLLGRFERSASEFYQDYVHNNDSFDDAEMLKMSKLTANILRGIDFHRVKALRTANFSYLHERLYSVNQLSLIHTEGAFAYPLWLKNGAMIRRELISRKVFVPLLWPNVLEDVSSSALEYDFADNIIPIPCDQRYGKEEMKYICDLVLNLL